MRVLTVLLFCAVATPSCAAPTAFDGDWQVTVTCDNARDGAHGYTWTFPATVTEGALHGVYGTPGMPSSFDLIGTIAPDGTAHLFGRGETGAVDYSVGRVAPGTRFAYHADGRFTVSRGEAHRIELRPCLLDFIRR